MLINSLRPRLNKRHFADDIFKCIFLNENVWILLKISLKFVPKVRINNIPTLVQIVAWRRPGDKPLSEPMLVILLTHICVTRPQWVKDSILLEKDMHIFMYTCISVVENILLTYVKEVCMLFPVFWILHIQKQQLKSNKYLLPVTWKPMPIWALTKFCTFLNSRTSIH